MKQTKKVRKKKTVIQNHHISYKPEVVVKIYKGEHKILTLIQWYTKKKVSKGFIKSIKHWLALNEDRAEEVVK